MATIKQGILGGFSGKIGSVIGSSWKGIATMRSKPLSVANPKTAGQVAQRSKMSNIVAYAQAILGTIIKPLWDRFSSQASGYNDFVSTNIALFTSELPSTPANLVISNGKMATTLITSAVYNVGGSEVVIEWDANDLSGLKLATDVPFAVVVNRTRKTIYPFNGLGIGTTRATGSLSVNPIEDIALNDDVDVYLAFRRADGTVVDKNSYTTFKG